LTSDVLSLALRARKRVQIRSRRICRRAARGCALLPSRNTPAGLRWRDRVAAICHAGNPGVFRPK